MAVIDSQVVQLFCMLLFITIVSCFFIYHYSKGKDISDPDAKIQRLHTFYIAGILVFLVIELITSICMGNSGRDEILRYVSFAATVSSLIMSVVAIIFTIVYSSRGDEQYKKIDNASDKVSNSLIEFTKRTQDIDSTVSLFKETSDLLTGKMEAIISELKDVKSMTEEIKDTTQSNQANSESGDFSWDTEGKKHKNVLEQFIYSGSFNGNCALYACVLSKDSGKRFSMSDIPDGNPNAVNYRYGYIIAASALGLIDGEINRDDCLIKYYYPPIKELLEEDLKQSINKSNTEIRQSRFDAIKAFFGRD